VNKPFELILFVAVMAWVGWVFIAETPMERLDHTCRPVNWIGRAASSLVSIVSIEGEEKTAAFFDDRVHNCKMFMWKQFYQVRYEEMVKAKADEARQAAAKKVTNDLLPAK